VRNMKKIIIIITCLVLATLFVSGCKKSEETVLNPKISFINAAPTTINSGGRSSITVSVANARDGVYVTTTCDVGSISPGITYTTGNVVWFDYVGPIVTGNNVNALISIQAVDDGGKVHDKADIKITIKGA
jgi:hypothetical protein